MPDLEERVAALEEAIAHPPRLIWNPVSDEDVEKFRKEYGAALEHIGHQPYPLPSSVPPLTPEQVRYLLRECVTVVKPGETLIVRVGFDIMPQQVRELQNAADGMCEYRDFPFKVLVFPGEELAIAEPGEVPGAP
jgi:hypothetical protein